jgi:hypothetical protein
MKRSSWRIASSIGNAWATSVLRRRWMRTLSAGTPLSGRTNSSSRSLVRMRWPTMRTAPMAMISSLRVFRPVVSQSSATHSLGGGGSSRKA